MSDPFSSPWFHCYFQGWILILQSIGSHFGCVIVSQMHLGSTWWQQIYIYQNVDQRCIYILREVLARFFLVKLVHNDGNKMYLLINKKVGSLVGKQDLQRYLSRGNWVCLTTLIGLMSHSHPSINICFAHILKVCFFINYISKVLSL